MHVERRAKPRARSPQGAMGLMQIMPETWADLRARYGLGADPFDPARQHSGWCRIHPRDSTIATARRVSRCLQCRTWTLRTSSGDGSTAAGETQAYVATLAPMINRVLTKVQLGAVARSFAWANSSLFAARNPHGVRRLRLSPHAPSDPRSSRAHAIVDLSALVPHRATCSSPSERVQGRCNEFDRVASSACRAASACAERGSGEQGDLQSTDGKIKAPTVGRAHVVGGVEVLRQSYECQRAGALPTNTNDFNGASAIAPLNAVLRP